MNLKTVASMMAPTPAKPPKYEPPFGGVSRTMVQKFAALVKTTTVTPEELASLREAQTRWNAIRADMEKNSADGLLRAYRDLMKSSDGLPEPGDILDRHEAERRAKSIREILKNRMRAISAEMLPLRKTLRLRLADICSKAADILEERERKVADEYGTIFRPSEALYGARWASVNSNLVIDDWTIDAGATPLGRVAHMIPEHIKP